ncbi:pilus assembly protein TadG-related protein [Arthrobacter sp. MDT1-48-3]
MRNTLTLARVQPVADERGAVAVIVALLMVVLLGFAALVVDIGMLYAEKAELQNGADAAALGVAQHCAAGACGTINTTASSLASGNARDDFATATPTVTGNTVTVKTSTLNPDGSHALAHFFAPVLGIDSTEVGATASAAWGSPSAGPAILPLTFSMCQFDPALTGTTRLIQYNTGPSCVGPTGHAIPGGFGWLKTPAGACSVNVDTATARTASDTGNSFPGVCLDELETMKNQTILIPVFEDTGGSGNNGWYKIYGFAAFEITGWKFGGNGQTGLNWNNSPSCTGNCRGIIGSFQRFVTLDTDFTFGGPNLGARSVHLTQ